MSTSTTWANRIENDTRVHASNHQDAWSADDLELVMTMTDVATDEEIAYAVGRTLYAVWAIQHRVRSGELNVDTLVAMRAPRVAMPTCSTCFTEILPTGACAFDCNA